MCKMFPLAMSVESPRSSVFTFESAVHSSHVLRCLDDQRRRDILCDVTVVVEGQSFRAHRSVLASCSEYFTHRVSSHTGQGMVITLPQEVTVTGFEPLLKFAYTSKLLFSKDNVIEISNSAAVLGFRDLDKACFDFLLPKFFPSTKGSAPFQKRTCCKKKCKSKLPKADSGIDNDDTLEDEKEVKPVSDPPDKREVAWLNNKSVNDEKGSKSSTPILPPVADEGPTDYSAQCPKYRKFQLACGKEACGTEKSLKCPVAVIKDDCFMPYLPCTSNCSSRDKPAVESHGQSFSNPHRLGNGTVDEPLQTGADERETEKAERKGEVDSIKREVDKSEGNWDERRGEMGTKRIEVDMELVAAGASCSDSIPPLTERSSVRGVSVGTSPGLPEESLGLILHRCPLAPREGCPRIGSVGQEELVMGVKEDRKAGDSGIEESVSIHLKAEGQDISERRRVDIKMDRGCQDRGRGVERRSVESMILDEERKIEGREGSSVEREVAEQLAKGLWLDFSSPPVLPQDPDTGCGASDPGTSKGKGPSLDWLKCQLNLNSGTGACPFLQELDTARRGTERDTWEAKLSGSEGVSQAGESPCVSSLNSGEDGDSDDFETGDMESPSERAKQVQLPFSVEWIVDLSRNDFQQMLKQQSLTDEQLNFVHDMRRRSKNRIAAQRCRKRKLDCIYNLECEINKLRTERGKLMAEKSQLNQMKLTTWHSVSALCQRVCSEANLQPQQLQVLAKYTSPDCSLSTLIPHIDSLLTGSGVPLQPQASLSAGPSGSDVHQASLESSPSTSSDLVMGNPR